MPDKQIATLYIVATPIGNLADISQRALATLQHVDLIAAEDTRHSRHLLHHYAITTSTLSLHQHNEQQRSELLLTKLQQGESVALISDAGTPLISDPGYRLVCLAQQQHIRVVPIPGSCALISALSASGLAANRFSFQGFLPAKAAARQQILSALANASDTLIFYESPRRLAACLADMVTIFGDDRLACLARELTKLHETIITEPLAELLATVTEDPNQQRGECVLLLASNPQPVSGSDQQINTMLTVLLTELSTNKAAAMTASLLNISKNEAYARALKLQQPS